MVVTKNNNDSKILLNTDFEMDSLAEAKMRFIEQICQKESARKAVLIFHQCCKFSFTGLNVPAEGAKPT